MKNDNFQEHLQFVISNRQDSNTYITLGVRGFLVHGIISSLEDYNTSMAHLAQEEGNVENVISATEYLSERKDEAFDRDGAREIGDTIFLKEAVVIYQNGQMTSKLFYWRGRLSSVDFIMSVGHPEPPTHQN